MLKLSSKTFLNKIVQPDMRRRIGRRNIVARDIFKNNNETASEDNLQV